jgi:hypothetical protein
VNIMFLGLINLDINLKHVFMWFIFSHKYFWHFMLNIYFWLPKQLQQKVACYHYIPTTNWNLRKTRNQKSMSVVTQNFHKTGKSLQNNFKLSFCFNIMEYFIIECISLNPQNAGLQMLDFSTTDKSHYDDQLLGPSISHWQAILYNI